MKQIAVKRQARTALSISLLVVIGAGFSTLSSASNNSVAIENVSNYQQITITPGDSLWSIAALVAPPGQIAALVADIVEVNKLGSADLLAGMKILIPTK
jgi:fucose permease